MTYISLGVQITSLVLLRRKTHSVNIFPPTHQIKTLVYGKVKFNQVVQVLGPWSHVQLAAVTGRTLGTKSFYSIEVDQVISFVNPYASSVIVVDSNIYYSPDLISWAWATGRWGLLSHAQNAVRWLALSRSMHIMKRL